MGQSSSAEDPSGAAASEATTAKTCYYELLGVARDATQDDIKKAYKKKALELHPDRNYNDTERATRQFTEVQAAYEVISDPQERAWYDSHRDAILRDDGTDTGGGGGAGSGGSSSAGATSTTTTQDVLRWFSLFGRKPSYDAADPRSFFVLVGQAFAQLAAEEAAAAEWEGLDPVYYPDFGGAGSGYADWVRAFYVEWGNFRTVKSFSWCDAYRYSEAPDRRVKRMMEAENRKLRDAAIREFNDSVRSFVAFVRKRDPRFTPNSQTEKQRQDALRAAAKEQAARQRAENAAKRSNYTAADWTNVADDPYDSASHSEEEEEEAQQEKDEEKEEVGQEEAEAEQEEEEEERYECIVCRKTFASEGPMLDHNRSQKHTRAVWELKKQMRKENKEFNLDRDVRGRKQPAEFKPIDPDPDEEDDDLSTEEDNLSADEEEESKAPAEEEEEESKPPVKEQPPNPHPAPAPEAEQADLSEADDDDYVSPATFAARLRGDLSSLALSDNDEEDLSSSKPPPPPPQQQQQKPGKAKAKEAKRAAAAAAAAASGASGEGKGTSACAVCMQSFASNTKMFNHLRDNPSHAVPVAGRKEKEKEKEKGKGKGKAGKGGKGKKK